MIKKDIRRRFHNIHILEDIVQGEVEISELLNVIMIYIRAYPKTNFHFYNFKEF
jgi:hypothetical protein